MKSHVLTILLFFGLCFLAACRASKELKARGERTRTDEIGVVLHRVDSLCSTISERHNVKIEFYPLEYGLRTPATEAVPSSTLPADSTHVGAPKNGGWSGFGSMGAVKSIEITSETEASTQHNAFTDSTAVSKTAEAETLQREKASETRHDNGTVLIVSVVAGLVVFALAWLLLKTFLKR